MLHVKINNNDLSRLGTTHSSSTQSWHLLAFDNHRLQLCAKNLPMLHTQVFNHQLPTDLKELDNLKNKTGI